MNENENLTDVETAMLDAEDGTDAYDTDDVDSAEADNDTEDYEDDADDVDDTDADDLDDDYGEDPEEEDPDDDPAGDADDDADAADDEADSALSSEDDKVSRLERELEKYKKLGRRALDALGVESDDVITGFEQLAADVAGKSLEEHRRDTEKQDAEDKERAEFDEYKRKKANLAFEKKALADLAEIQKECPETKKYKHFSEMPNSKRYAELMATEKMTPVEAYLASHPRESRQGIVEATKQQSLNDTKRHLKSAVPNNGGSGDPAYISKSEMRRYREMFPEMSDTEIRALHKRATS